MNTAISTYYDRQMSDLELIHFEANMALSERLREECANDCYENFLISNSIKLAKMRSCQRASKLTKMLEESFMNQENKKKLAILPINIYTVIFKGFYKHN